MYLTIIVRAFYVSPGISGDPPEISGRSPEIFGDPPEISGAPPKISGDPPSVSGAQLLNYSFQNQKSSNSQLVLVSNLEPTMKKFNQPVNS